MVDGGGGQLVEKLSRSWRIVKKSNNCPELKNLGVTHLNTQDKLINRLTN